jgi:hypothetical protein
MPINVTSTFSAAAPFTGTWETPMIGYVSTDSSLSGAMGLSTPNTMLGYTIEAVGLVTPEGSPMFLLLMAAGTPATFFSQITVQRGAGITTYSEGAATFYPTGTTVIDGIAVPATDGPAWLWADVSSDFTTGTITTLNPIQAAPTAPQGNGDVTDPEAWEDNNGNIPPLEFSNVPLNVNYPLNGDGRYWFAVNAATADSGSPIKFIGNPSYYIDNINLQWSVVSTANDGSGLILAYSTNGGASWTPTTLLPQTQLKGIQNGAVPVGLAGCTGLQVKVYAQGGTVTAGATLSEVAVAITRNFNEQITWDNPNPFDPVNYNALALDNNIPTSTLAALTTRTLIRLGFANQAANPPPGMTALIQDFLISAQTFLYKRYTQLHTKRFFRWKVNPGQRFYSLKDNDENVLEGVTMDPNKTIEWCGIQDSRNVWYPMIQGIPPQLYTMITKPWRPARYELRGAIEIYPAPDQTYWLWVRAHFGLMSFANPTDTTTIDAELVFLWALANAKAHYGQPDAQNVAGQANSYKAELIAATHQTAHYVPGTIAVPPAVRPTLVQFDANNGGGS